MQAREGVIIEEQDIRKIQNKVFLGTLKPPKVTIAEADKWRKQYLKERGESSDIEYFLSYLRNKAYSQKGTTRDLELLARTEGWLIDRREVDHKVEFTPADYITTSKNLIKRLKKSNGGVCPVCGKPAILLSEVCVDSEQKYSTGRSMATMAISSPAP